MLLLLHTVFNMHMEKPSISFLTVKPLRCTTLTATALAVEVECNERSLDVERSRGLIEEEVWDQLFNTSEGSI